MDYPGIGPEHSFLSDIGRAEYYAVTDDEALEAFQQVSRLEGIIPALETSHAFAYLKVHLPVKAPHQVPGRVAVKSEQHRHLPLFQYNLHITPQLRNNLVGRKA